MLSLDLMPLSDTEIADWFREAWSEESHTAPWKPALETLSSEQALWKPPGLPVKHSIWDLVQHMSFWRELFMRELDGEKRTPDEVARRNWGPIDDTSEMAWRQAVTRYAELNDQMIEAINESADKAKRLVYFIEHDSYHFGQIMLLRALQGMPPLDSYG